MYYEPEFLSVAEQYKTLLQGKDAQALTKFMDDRKALTIRRLHFKLDIYASNVRPLWKTIDPKLVNALAAKEGRREVLAFKQKWAKRRAQFEKHHGEFLQVDRGAKRVFPGFEDAATQFLPLLTGGAHDPDATVTAEEFAAADAAVLAYADEYLRKFQHDLARLVQQFDLMHVCKGSGNVPPMEHHITFEPPRAQTDLGNVNQAVAF
ncbi:hypothetical protein BD413DRAFT_608512 [Trametes elegans]|nr:hypothetical protein BD413DRAFT_608512 [Trametes elegans]